MNTKPGPLKLSRAAVRRLGGASELDRFSRGGWVKVVEAVKLSGLSDRHLRRLIREAEGNDAIRHRTDLGILRVWHADVPVRPAKVDPDSVDLSPPKGAK